MTDTYKATDTNDTRRGLNWQHYIDAFKLYYKFMNDHFSEELQSHREKNPQLYVPTDKIRVSAENKLTPRDGYLAFYCDLLGFSAEIIGSGTDSLPDYYGAALVSAMDNPDVQVYLLSDSCLAFATIENVESFLKFVSFIFPQWLADGMLPQGFVGYGSFVERKPDFGPLPENFFGTQVTGTALVDAVNIQKNNKPLGSRILISESSIKKLPSGIRTAVDADGNIELILEHPRQFCLLECIYYLLCLRTQKSGTRPFEHCIWSAVSRTLYGDTLILEIASDLVKPYFGERELNNIVGSINYILEKYKYT